MEREKKEVRKKKEDYIREELLDKFAEVFGSSEGAKVYFAPGASS